MSRSVWTQGIGGHGAGPVGSVRGGRPSVSGLGMGMGAGPALAERSANSRAATIPVPTPRDNLNLIYLVAACSDKRHESGR